ncbi:MULTISPECIES: hypothetical protein [Kitasatospora]|uniref:Uncharacterized protein n=1 Tax=Kitasatospora cathayae TaxID=3004092 RepID=A0ABY7PXU5_9ACTN|nr:hypothetical protein [Kitasatospora sp. HUAS 3-15]WBP84801.1 hypothetical protein O1G21_02360 [Kitasatospora sp. HUAS 3-15]
MTGPHSQEDRGEPTVRRFAAGSFAGVFAVTAVVLAVLAAVLPVDGVTTGFCALAALLFALLAVGTTVERVVVRRRSDRPRHGGGPPVRDS